MIALALVTLLLSCKKDRDGIGDPNDIPPGQELVMTYNKYAGDSIHYDSKGRIVESWINTIHGTYYEYPYVGEIVVRSKNRVTDKTSVYYVITILDGKADHFQAFALKPDGTVEKNWISQFTYQDNRLVKITNDAGNNVDILFEYTNNLPTKIIRGTDTAKLDYDMAHKLPVAVVNNSYGLMYDDYYCLSGLFHDGLFGEMPMYAVNKINRDGFFDVITFTNTFGSYNELLRSEQGQSSIYNYLNMEMRYKMVPVNP
jgi:hypothetical protein